MGNINAVSLPKLQKEAQSGIYDVILHVGDFAYDMNNVSTMLQLLPFVKFSSVFYYINLQQK